MSFFELYNGCRLPEDIQAKAQGFALCADSLDEYWFRAGYWCGKYIKKEDIDGENDRGQEDVQVRP